MLQRDPKHIKLLSNDSIFRALSDGIYRIFSVPGPKTLSAKTLNQCQFYKNFWACLTCEEKFYSTENKDLTYSRKLSIRRNRSFSKIPRLLTTLPNNLRVIERSFRKSPSLRENPDQEKFPKLVEFLKDLTNRGLFEIIYPELVEYARRTKKETMRYRNLKNQIIF